MCFSCSGPQNGLDRDGRKQSGDGVYALRLASDWKGETGIDSVCGEREVHVVSVRRDDGEDD